MSEIDGFAVFAVAVRALGYAAGLSAAGSALFLAAFGSRRFQASGAAMDGAMRATRRLGILAGVAALTMLALGIGARAGRLSGLGFGGMTDGVMIDVVLDGPVGTAAWMRLTGLAAIVAGLAWRRRPGLLVAVAGALALAASYTMAGHATTRPWLPPVVALHVLAAAFWFGALAPLATATRTFVPADAAHLLEAFGRVAVGVVGMLVAAGAVTALALLGGPAGLFGTPYGWLLLGKLAAVAGLFGLAAMNKLALVPSLSRGDAAAAGRLVRSIRLEAAAILIILAVTATLTSTASPPTTEGA